MKYPEVVPGEARNLWQVQVVAGAVIYHLTRGEYQNIVLNVINILKLAFVAYGRTTKAPLTDRDVAVSEI